MSFASVIKVYEQRAAAAFGFLHTEFGLDGPRADGNVIPVVSFSGGALRYRVMLETDDKAVTTRVRLDLGATRLTAELPDLVAAAGLGPAPQVPTSARTQHDLERALADQARLVRRLHPRLTAPDAAALMRAAHAHVS
jgi:hypothetical protein